MFKSLLMFREEIYPEIYDILILRFNSTWLSLPKASTPKSRGTGNGYKNTAWEKKCAYL